MGTKVSEKFRYLKTDGLRTDIVMPTRLMWTSAGVSRGEKLLKATDTQPLLVVEGEFALLDTRGGKQAALLLDFGCEFAGGVQIVSRTGGVHMHIRFGESAAEAMTPLGEKGSTNDHAVRDMQVLLPWNGTQRFGQTGFRFVYIELTEPETLIDIVAVQGVVTYRDLPYLGSFVCSDKLLGDIYDTCAYTAHVCMQELLWDGIKRDRVVWIGDMHPELLAIQAVFGHVPMLEDCLRITAERYPHPAWPNNMATYGLWYLMILWDMYLHSGNDALVQELAYYWQPLLRRFTDIVHEDGGPVLAEDDLLRGFFLDWPTKDTPQAEAAINALMSRTMAVGADLCGLIGDSALAARCRAKKAVLDANHLTCYDKKQVVAHMYLAGQLPADETARLLTDGCGKGMSTFMSNYILTAAARTAGVADALAMLRQYYGGMLAAGATTFWEDFDLDWLRKGARIDELPAPGAYDIHGDNGRYCYTGLRHSLCHGWSAGPAAFLANEVLGIHILAPGCKKIAVKPDLGDLDWAEGSYPTPQGVVHVRAEKANGETVVTVDAPQGVEVVG